MNGERKVHWVAWEKMCACKKERGMGFRDFEAFNQALLAKQACCILQVPGSLCARVLKARYFPNGDLLTTTCPNGGSFMWRSIFHGRDLLKHGIIWRIGNGSKVNIATGDWVPRHGCMKPLGLVSSPNCNMVSDLLNHNETERDGPILSRMSKMWNR